MGASTPAICTDAERRTTTKLRIVTQRQQQVARVDFENDDDIAGRVARDVGRRHRAPRATADVVLVSDYLKGASPGP